MAGDEGLGTAFIHASMLNMYPLLKKDGLTQAYWALLLMHLGIATLLPPKHRQVNQLGEAWWQRLVASVCSQPPLVSLGGIVAVHALTSTAKLPPKYPYLADAIMVSWAFVHFASVYVYMHVQQYNKWKSTGHTV